MIETKCCCTTAICLTARLRQENYALRAVVDEQEKELSLLRAAVGHFYGIVTEPVVDLEAVAVAEALEWILHGPKESSAEELSAGTTCAQQLRFLARTGNSYTPNCT